MARLAHLTILHLDWAQPPTSALGLGCNQCHLNDLLGCRHWPAMQVSAKERLRRNHSRDNRLYPEVEHLVRLEPYSLYGPDASFCQALLSFGFFRDISENRMSGAMPSTFTRLSFLQRLCAALLNCELCEGSHSGNGR